MGGTLPGGFPVWGGTLSGGGYPAGGFPVWGGSCLGGYPARGYPVGGRGVPCRGGGTLPGGGSYLCGVQAATELFCCELALYSLMPHGIMGNVAKHHGSKKNKK